MKLSNTYGEITISNVMQKLILKATMTHDFGLFVYEATTENLYRVFTDDQGILQVKPLVFGPEFRTVATRELGTNKQRFDKDWQATLCDFADVVVESNGGNSAAVQDYLLVSDKGLSFFVAPDDALDKARHKSNVPPQPPAVLTEIRHGSEDECRKAASPGRFVTDRNDAFALHHDPSCDSFVHHLLVPEKDSTPLRNLMKSVYEMSLKMKNKDKILVPKLKGGGEEDYERDSLIPLVGDLRDYRRIQLSVYGVTSDLEHLVDLHQDGMKNDDATALVVKNATLAIKAAEKISETGGKTNLSILEAQALIICLVWFLSTMTEDEETSTFAIQSRIHDAIQSLQQSKKEFFARSCVSEQIVSLHSLSVAGRSSYPPMVAYSRDVRCAAALREEFQASVEEFVGSRAAATLEASVGFLFTSNSVPPNVESFPVQFPDGTSVDVEWIPVEDIGRDNESGPTKDLIVSAGHHDMTVVDNVASVEALSAPLCGAPTKKTGYLCQNKTWDKSGKCRYHRK